MQVLNFGSLNIDHVYRVPSIVAPGETLSSISYATFAGGKGANQSVALARAGADVFHAGCVGADGNWLVEKLRGYGVDTSFIRVVDGPTGHAIIQVDEVGQNAIVLHAGANHCVSSEHVADVLAHFKPGDTVLLQNEINDVPAIIAAAYDRKLNVCLNPAPFDKSVLHYPLDLLHTLVVNETEGAGLAGVSETDGILDTLAARLPKCEIILTMGRKGASYRSPDTRFTIPAVQVAAVDTTAAGDTFIGFYLARRATGDGAEAALKTACAAAAVSVTKQGAMDSIPRLADVS
jgi:ribokinase